MTISDVAGAPASDVAATTPRVRTPRLRRYAMTAPTFFTVEYAINPWMDTSTPVDAALAVRQWEQLLSTYRALGHTVELVEPVAGLPDMVYAANGGLIVDGTAIVARFAYPQRAGEAVAYAEWMSSHGFEPALHPPRQRGPGRPAGRRLDDLGGLRLSHRSCAPTTRSPSITGMPVVSLELVDPRFYHLDTALAVLDDNTIAYYPPAFSDDARARLQRAVPRRHRGRDAPTPTCSASTSSPTACTSCCPPPPPASPRQTRRRRLRTDRRRPVRAAQGRRIRQMLHAGGVLVTILDTVD